MPGKYSLDYCSDSQCSLIVFTMCIRMYADHKELWAGIIKDLYDKVELFLSKHNSEQFFQAYPEQRKKLISSRKSVFEKNYLLEWRVQKAVKLLTEKYGGKTWLRLFLLLLVVLFLIVIISTVLLLAGKKARSSFVNIMSNVGVIGTLLPLLETLLKKQIGDTIIYISGVITASVSVLTAIQLVYLTVVNTGTSRGDAILAEAVSIKDSIGFLQRVGKIIVDTTL